MVDRKVIVVGAGIFGATAAIALRKRGYAVSLFDPGPLPHPLAASTDISKVVRMDYGPDEDYLALVENALEGWRRWNSSWPEPLYHETGVLFLTRAPMAPGGYEHESFQLLRRRGHRPERLDAAEIRRRFPEWNAAWTPHALPCMADSLRSIETFPRLAEAPIVYTRVCLYCDTWDEHLWIARDPEREGLVVAAGGSGHAFKFAPALGDLIADALEDAPNPLLRKFRWRPEARPARGQEAARHHAERAGG